MTRDVPLLDMALSAMGFVVCFVWCVWCVWPVRNPFASILRAHRANQRQRDLEVVWPACVYGSKSIGEARYKFLLHVMFSPHWADEPGERVWSLVEELKP